MDFGPDMKHSEKPTARLGADPVQPVQYEHRFEPSARIDLHDGNPLKGALAFGIDLSNPQVMAQREPPPWRPESGGQLVGKMHEYTRINPIKVSNEGPIGAISLPPGWNEVIPPPPKPGTFVFQVKDGRSFVPPDHADNPSVAIHMGHGLGLRPVPQEAETALRQVLQLKPAAHGPQRLTAEEFKSLSGLMMPLEGGNNQYHDPGAYGTKFNVISASTINIHGKTALLVKGDFLNPDGSASGLMRESIFIDNDQTAAGTPGTRIERIDLTAPREKIQQYENQYWDAIKTIQWPTVLRP